MAAFVQMTGIIICPLLKSSWPRDAAFLYRNGTINSTGYDSEDEQMLGAL